MALRTPVIHCLIDPEPTSFHATDVAGQTVTFAANLSFEAPARQTSTTKDEIEKEIEQDEAEALPKLAAMLAGLKQLQFHVYQLSPPVADGAPYTLTMADTALMGGVSVPPNQNEAQNGYVRDWLDDQKSKGSSRYWTSLEVDSKNPEQEVDAEKAGAAPRLRAAQAWNAPVAHRQGFTHLVRLAPLPDNTIYLVLPFLADPAGAVPTDVKLIPDPKGASPDWAVTAVECKYVLGGLGEWRCRTNAVGRVGQDLVVAPPPSAPLDDMLTAEGFLAVNPDAEEIRRFLKIFEERAASIMTAANALHVDGKEDATALETICGFKFVGDKPKPGDADTRPCLWGSTIWYVVARLVAALDNHVLSLLKPIAVAGAWVPNPKSEGDVLAPLVSAILQEIDALEIAGDFDGKQIAADIRAVLTAYCPLVAGGPEALLVPALRLVYGIAERTYKAVLDPAEPANLASSMLASYAKGGNYDEVPAEVMDYVRSLEGKSIDTLAAALIDLEQPLYEESGSERALVHLFESAQINAAEPGKPPTTGNTLTYRIAATIANKGDPHGPEVPSGALITAVESAWAKYKALLEGPFNGAEAIRRAVSASFADALLKEASVVKEKFTALRLRGLTATAQFYKWRLIGEAIGPNAFEIMTGPLVRPDKYRPVLGVDFLERMDQAYTRAAEPLVVAPDTEGCFIPDSFPQPLPIQIASGIDGNAVDGFAKAFNGICVAIRRDENGAKWAHANLADLTWQGTASGALHPMLPAVSDGRGPMFIDYEGFPFADATNKDRFAADVGAGPHTTYAQHAPHDYQGSGFEQLPRLAYGRRFQSFGFAVSNAGVPPLGLQVGPNEPWMPGPKIDQLVDPSKPETSPPLYETNYQRRTAIARMAVIEQPAPGASRRLGESIKGVQPLCADYPRLGLVADTVWPGVIDLFRDSDGAPRMHVPQKIERPVEWKLEEFEWVGEPLSLTLTLFDRVPSEPGGAVVRSKSIPAKRIGPGGLVLAAKDVATKDGKAARIVEISSEGTKLDEIEIDPAEASYWLRVELKVIAGKPASLSFADPEGKRPAGDAAPLILLQPDGNASQVWRKDLPSTITVRVSTPRVGYLDFMRWTSNSTLRGEAYSAGGEVFELALLTAYVMRHLDPVLAQHLDNLPDPAVDAIRIELMQTDRIAGDKAGSLVGQFQLGPSTSGGKKEGLLAAFVRKLEVLKDPQWTPERLRKVVFDELDKIFSFDIELAAGAKLDLATGFKITVPAGAVAHLSMHAVVLGKHFQKRDGHPAVFHKGLKQYAARQVGAGNKQLLSYRASAIRIETMYDGIGAKPEKSPVWIDAAAAMIEARPVSNARRFDLTTYDQIAVGVARNDWRLLSEIDVTTQRWRPTGRPIYHFVSPGKHTLDGKEIRGPAVPMAIPDEVAGFESEAFFDRPDIDANTVTQRLVPLGTQTVLQQFPWDSPSATYFRHRFTLRSRYAGALLQESRRSVDAWPRENILKEHAWTKRVAMLADSSRLILTRPQLRALIPLTTAPGGEGLATPTPPIAAILQEPPYSRGGLADRIAPELKTGFGYGFEKGELNKQGTTDKPPVEILDSRKEIGPNPQLSYSPFEYGQVLGLCLRSEGPLGLTFDMPDTPAPAFPNTMLSLRPVSLIGSEPAFEEGLMGVAMRRYLDPDWLTSPTVSAGDVKPVEGVPAAELNLPADRTWWIDVNTDTADIAGVAETGVSLKVANVREVDGFTGVEVWKESIDKVKGYFKETTLVAKAQTSRIDGLVLLHQPIAPGRYSTSVFARRKSASVAEGDSSAPMILASFEWSLPVVEKVDGEKRQGAVPMQAAVLKITGSDIVARETMASATTSLRWTQISRDFDLLRVAGEEKPYLARNLVARLEDKLLKFDLVKGKTDVAMLPSTQGNRYPSHVHRHIGFITSRFLRELGRPVETFCGTALAAGPATVIFETEGASQAVRVVEFETPASIVCQQDLAAPDTYRKAYFDLVSTGYESENDLLLTLRFVGSQQHLSQFSGVTILLSQPVDPVAASKTEKNTIHIPLKPTKDVWPVGARVILRPGASGKVPRVETWIVFSDGLEKPTGEKAEFDLNLSGNYPGFMLALKAEGSKAEFWTDISMLHCKQNMNELTAAAGKPPGPAVAFHFDWLFGQVEGSSEPATQVGPSRLAGMTEAQARIVSVSQPISIISKGP